MNTADASTATKIWRWNLSGLGYSSTGYNGTYKTAITQDGHIVADFIDTGTLTANIIKAGIMQSTNGEFSFNLESGHIEASDINITGGDINLDGGTLSILNNDGYKADFSGGVVELYQGAGTGIGTGTKYLSLYNSLIGGKWYATLASPSYTLGGASSGGFRIGTSTDNVAATSSWNTDFALISKDNARFRTKIEVNEPLNVATGGDAIGFISHAPFGAKDISVELGAKSNAHGILQLGNNTDGTTPARMEFYSSGTGGAGMALELIGSSLSGKIFVDTSGIYAQFGSYKPQLIAGKVV